MAHYLCDIDGSTAEETHLIPTVNAIFELIKSTCPHSANNEQLDNYITDCANRCVRGFYKYTNPEERSPRDAVLGSWKPDAKIQRDNMEDEELLDIMTVMVEVIADVVSIVRDIGFPKLLDPTLFHSIAQDVHLYPPGYYYESIRNIALGLKKLVSSDPIIALAQITQFLTGTAMHIEDEKRHFSFIAQLCTMKNAFHLLYHLILCAIVRGIYNISKTFYPNPGTRWKLCMGHKTVLFSRLDWQNQSPQNLFSAFLNAADLDRVSNLIEGGLAVRDPTAGISILAPSLASDRILKQISGVFVDRNDEITFHSKGSIVCGILNEVDYDIVDQVTKDQVSRPEYASYGDYFTEQVIKEMFKISPAPKRRCAVSRSGICMFFCEEIDLRRIGRRLTIRNEPRLNKLLRDLPTRSDGGIEIQNQLIEIRKAQLSTSLNVVNAIDPDDLKKYKRIINRPGRVLVRRREIERFCCFLYLTCLVIFGLISLVLNWGGRDNWLERIFDSVQIVSLGTSIALLGLFLYVRTGTNTIDLINGVVEVTNLDELLSVTGLKMETLQMILSYERGSVYWLNADNCGYASGMEEGMIRFEHPADRYSSFELETILHDEKHGYCLAQGRFVEVKVEQNVVYLMDGEFTDCVIDVLMDRAQYVG